MLYMKQADNTEEICSLDFYYKKMKHLFFLVLLANSILATAQIKRLDTLAQLGRSGYRVYTSNKSNDKNAVNIKLVGFESEARDLDFTVEGKIKSIAVEDFNNDGFPDLLLFIYSGADFCKATVIGIASEENKSCVPIFFPDIRDDAKLRVGYNGHDEFTIIEGNLFRKFPVYNPDNLTGLPTDIKRNIQYRVVKGEKGAYKFQVLRTYESK
jgi:hypothetical protein